MQFDDGGYFHIVKGYGKEELQEDKECVNKIYNSIRNLFQSYHKNSMMLATFGKKYKTI